MSTNDLDPPPSAQLFVYSYGVAERGGTRVPLFSFPFPRLERVVEKRGARAGSTCVIGQDKESEASPTNKGNHPRRVEVFGSENGGRRGEGEVIIRFETGF